MASWQVCSHPGTGRYTDDTGATRSWVREIGHDVIFEMAGRFEIASTAVGTLVEMNLVFGKNGPEWWLRPELARMLTVPNAPTVRPHLLGIIPATARALAALMDLRECMFDTVQPASELSIFRLEFPQAESEPSVFRFQLGDTFPVIL